MPSTTRIVTDTKQITAIWHCRGKKIAEGIGIIQYDLSPISIKERNRQTRLRSSPARLGKNRTAYGEILVTDKTIPTWIVLRNVRRKIYKYDCDENYPKSGEGRTFFECSFEIEIRIHRTGSSSTIRTWSSRWYIVKLRNGRILY